MLRLCAHLPCSCASECTHTLTLTPSPTPSPTPTPTPAPTPTTPNALTHRLPKCSACRSYCRFTVVSPPCILLAIVVLGRLWVEASASLACSCLSECCSCRRKISHRRHCVPLVRSCGWLGGGGGLTAHGAVCPLVAISFSAATSLLSACSDDDQLYVRTTPPDLHPSSR